MTGSTDAGELPVRGKSLDVPPEAPVATYGKALLSQFLFDPSYRNLNHGIYITEPPHPLPPSLSMHELRHGNP